MSPNMFEVPMDENNPEALYCIGFEYSTAREISNRYNARPSPTQCPDDIWDYVNSHIGMLLIERLGLGAMAPRRAMTKIGLSQELQDAIMDPEFGQIFRTESLHSWVRGTLWGNFCAMLKLQQQREEDELANSKTSNRADAGTYELEPRATNLVFTTNISPSDSEITADRFTIGSEPPLLPDHLALYRGQTYSALPGHSYVSDYDQFISTGAFSSRGRQDFDFGRETWHWLKDKAVAEQYRQYAARRCPLSETWLVRIQIPNDFMDQLKVDQFYYDDDWREYMWCLQHKKTTPTKSRHLRRADVIMAHVSTRHNRELATIQQHDPHSAITRDYVLKNEATGVMAVQYVFTSWKIVEVLVELICGKTHVEISPAIRSLEQSDFEDDSTSEADALDSDEWEFIDTTCWALL